jgi:hypothetical protein
MLPGVRRSVGAALASLALAAHSAFAATATRNLVLVTLDGVRVEEFFAGMDMAVAKEEAKREDFDLAELSAAYWRDTPGERRAVTMPFFWSTLAPQGMVFGNRERGSRVTVRNDQWFSYPGYAEILTGSPQPEITSNDLVRYPHVTVLDHLRGRLGLSFTEVAQIGSWDGFKMAASRRDGAFFMNGAYDDVPPALATPEMNVLTGLRKEVMQLWHEGSNDTLTFRLGLAYLRKHQPRVLWLGFSQSDDWAHARRYDRLLDYLRLMDGLLKELWETTQSLERYAGRTTLIITTDHGRGRTPADWHDHGAGIEGSEDIWIAVIGPDTPNRGEVADVAPLTQSQIAATMLQLLGSSAEDFAETAAPPMSGVVSEE